MRLRRVFVSIVAAIVVMIAVVALPHHAAASYGCCMSVSVYNDPQGSTQPNEICLYGWNQNWNATWDCQVGSDYPPFGFLDDQIYNMSRWSTYWWQSGTTCVGPPYQCFGNVDIISYFPDGSSYGVNVVLPTQQSCDRSIGEDYQALAYSYTGGAYCY